jgi:peptidoglycan/xylan/chitin deacetylase (PgdA/CDA1 family)
VPLRRIVKNAREAFEVPRDLLLKRYPPFVTGGALPRGDVPVFVFHSVEPVSFERQLRHLADNGYATLDADRYFRLVMGAGPVPERAVVLTFDDGRASVWTVARPLLRRYGMKGIVFLVPGRIPDGDGKGPTWDDALAGRTTEATVLEREQKGQPFMTWPEIEASADVFDFQSHSFSHSRVHTSPQVEGFVTPGLRLGYSAFDLPLVEDDGRDLVGTEVPLGTPLLRSASRLSESLRFHEDPALRAECVALVKDEGEAGFFARPDWSKRLRRIVARNHVVGRTEEPAEREAAQRRELLESKRAIEAHTGRPVIHLCYPWHVSGPTAERLARETGYRTAFAGKVRGVPITRAGGDPHRIARLSEDYVLLLPGQGREELATVLQRKWARRLGGAS